MVASDDDYTTDAHSYPIVLSDNPQLDDALIVRLQYDIATRIHGADEIALRYGLKNKHELREYLRRHPQVVAGARRARTLLDSDQGTEDRVRIKALHATEELVIPIHDLAADPRTAMQQRLDAFKQLSRIAGVDGQREKAGAAAGGTGQNFVLNILFSGGETKHFEGTVINPDNVSAPTFKSPGAPSLSNTEYITEDEDGPLDDEDV